MRHIKLCISLNDSLSIPSGHMTSKRRRNNVGVTSLRHSDIITTSYQRHVPVGGSYELGAHGHTDLYMHYAHTIRYIFTL